MKEPRYAVQAPTELTNAAFLTCWVSEGFFPNEVAVKIDLADESLVAFVPARSVRGKVIADQVTQGELRVAIIRELDDQVMIGLPADTLSTGSRIVVGKELLHPLT